jgi:hypothetical protein
MALARTAAESIGLLSPTLIQTAKLNTVEPLAWLTDVLKRIVSGQTKHTLLPWNWKQQDKVAPVGSG